MLARVWCVCVSRKTIVRIESDNSTHDVYTRVNDNNNNSKKKRSKIL